MISFRYWVENGGARVPAIQPSPLAGFRLVSNVFEEAVTYGPNDQTRTTPAVRGDGPKQQSYAHLNIAGWLPLRAELLPRQCFEVVPNPTEVGQVNTDQSK